MTARSRTLACDDSFANTGAIDPITPKKKGGTHMSSQPNTSGASVPRAGIITKLSSGSVADTVARFSAMLIDRGLKLFAVIDHDGEAAASGLKLRETKLVIFGSPAAGTPVMDASPLAALDLPLKLLVWTDAHQTKVSYVAPDELAARYGLTGELTKRLSAIDALSDALTER